MIINLILPYLLICWLISKLTHLRIGTVDKYNVVEESRRLCRRGQSCWMRDEGERDLTTEYSTEIYLRDNSRGTIPIHKLFIYKLDIHF